MWKSAQVNKAFTSAQKFILPGLLSSVWLTAAFSAPGPVNRAPKDSSFFFFFWLIIIRFVYSLQGKGEVAARASALWH